MWLFNSKHNKEENIENDKKRKLSRIEYINDDDYLASREYISQLLMGLIEDLKKDHKNSELFNFGKSIGLNNGNIEIHKRRIAAEFVKLGYICKQMKEIENTYYKQQLFYYDNLDNELKVSSDYIKIESLKKDIDLKDPESFISKANKELEQNKQLLRDIEKEEWINTKETIYKKLQSAWKDHDQFTHQIQKKYQHSFISKINQQDEI